MATPVSFLAELKGQLEDIKSQAIPWWYSGASCLAALAWLCWFALIFLVLLGVIDRDWVTGMMAALVFVVAIFASAGWNKK